MLIQTAASLLPYNTLAFDQQTAYFAELFNDDDVVEACAYARQHQLPFLLLGAGSNIVFSQDFKGLIARFASVSPDVCQVLVEDETQIEVQVSAGVNWHEWVSYCLQQQWYGLENLALIPGTVGAAPVQNIGAYGVELKDFIVSVRAYDREQQGFVNLSRADCGFTYRHSEFKQSPGRYVITAVNFRLQKQFQAQCAYPVLATALAQHDHETLTAKHIFDAVINIRQQRLPDPALIPNVGSFFKNPVLSKEVVAALKQQYPQVPCYPFSESHEKIAEAWLIDQAGWKGYRNNQVGVHPEQALVLCHYPLAEEANTKAEIPAEQLMALARAIQADVDKRFGVKLELEPLLV